MRKKSQANGPQDNFNDNWPLFEKILGYYRYAKIVRYVNELPNLECVDIGCGFNGRFLFNISNKIKKGYGYDLRANSIRKGNIEIINNSKLGGDIPLEDGSIDRTFLLAVMEHLDNAEHVISEGVRILKQGGEDSDYYAHACI